MPTKKRAKKATKQPAKKVPVVEPKEVPERPQTHSKNIIGIAVVVILIALLLFVVWKLTSDSFGGTVVATVNGEPIYQEEINAVYNRLPVQFQEQFTKEQILNQTITEVLILQYAAKEGIVATSGEVDYRIAEMIASGGISRELLDQQLAAQNVTEEEFREYVRRLLVIEELQNTIPSQIQVTEDDILQAYISNEDNYQADEGEVHIKHLLVQTEEEAQSILEEYNSGIPFSDLAAEYSTDQTALNGGEIGFISEDTPVVEEFKSVALSLQVGEISDPVETQFGWHLIYRGEDTISLTEVREDLTQTVQQQKAQAFFSNLLDVLYTEADIVYKNDVE